MNFKAKFHAYRLFGLHTCSSLWPLLFIFTVGLFYGTAAADVFFESTRTIRYSAIIIGSFFAYFGSPTLIGFIHAAKLRRMYGQDVSDAMTAKFAHLKDGDTVDFTLAEVIDGVSRARRTAR